MRARNLKPGFFKNEVLADIRRPWGRLLFAGLSLLADREGRLEDRPRRIQAEIFPYDPDCPDVDEMLSLLEASPERFIIRYEVNGRRYIQITNFKVHNFPHHTEKASVIPPVESRTDTVNSPLIHRESTVDSPLDDGGNPPSRARVLNPESLNPESQISYATHTLAPSDGETITSEPPATTSKPHMRIKFDPDSLQFEGITQTDVETWGKAYPACSIPIELARAREWVVGHPEKRKKNWYRFLTGWFSRSQERGGTKHSNRDPETAWYYELQGKQCDDVS